MFSMGPVLARDNDHGVSDAEPERTAGYQKLIIHSNRIGIADPIEIGLGFAHSGRSNRRSRGASTPHGLPGGRQVIPKECDHA